MIGGPPSCHCENGAVGAGFDQNCEQDCTARAMGVLVTSNTEVVGSKRLLQRPELPRPGIAYCHQCTRRSAAACRLTRRAGSSIASPVERPWQRPRLQPSEGPASWTTMFWCVQ